MATSDPLDRMEAALEAKAAKDAERSAQLAQYRKAITLEGGYVFAPWSGRCMYCTADLVTLHAQGRSVSTGCPSCHHSFVE